MPSSKPNLFIVAAPSGTGKTTLTNRLVREIDDLEFSVSVTTRKKRPNEVEGRDYTFVDNASFMNSVNNDEFLEWEEVFGNKYGTKQSDIDSIQKQGYRVLLEIDVKGAVSVLKKRNEVCTIFILPPSLKVLWDRLSGRGTDPLKDRLLRLKEAVKELEKGQIFEHFIINDELSEAFGELKNLVQYNQKVILSRERGIKHCQLLVEEFRKADWLAEWRHHFQ